MNKILVFLIILAGMSCGQNKDYHSIVSKELAKGERRDSIFLGAMFKMPAKEFYDMCWKLNKEGLIMEGATNTTVKYPLKDLKRSANLEYYPLFKEGRIQSMTGNIYYDAWSPWNRELFSDELIEDVRQLFEKWYGDKFIPIEPLASAPLPGYNKAYAMITANRRVVIYNNRDERVEILISDLTDLDSIIEVEIKKR